MFRWLIVLTFVLSVITINVFGQKYDNNWILGPQYNPIEFPQDYYKPIELEFKDNGLSIQPFYNSIEMQLTSISISNKGGKLLFYTNGNHVESANNKRMENGDELNVGSPGSDLTSLNNQAYLNQYGYLVLPDPVDSNIFYILHSFLEFDKTYLLSSSKIQITKIDMSFNNGLGKVIYKNKTLVDTYSNLKINVIQHANGIDWWIMLRHPNGNSYNQLLLHRDSLIKSKEITLDSYELHDSHDTFALTEYFIYSSSNGEKIIDIYGQKIVRIFNFDRCSGDFYLTDTLNVKVDTIEKEIKGYTRWAGAQGCAISPNSRYLYVMNFSEIKQFDILSDSISKSKKIIPTKIPYYEEFGNVIEHQFVTLKVNQIGPDGKIYFLEGYNHHIMNNPDETAANVNFCSQPHCLGVNKLLLDPPYYPNYRLGPLKGSPCDTIISSIKYINKEVYNLKFGPNPSIGIVTVEISLPEYGNDKIELEIIDMLGRGAYEHIFPEYAYLHTIQAGSLVPGNYIGVLKRNGKSVKTANLVISR